MLTYYEILQTSGVVEGPPGEMMAANDVSLMTRILADWKFLAQQVGTQVAILHYEPDFWGYAAQSNLDPHMTPAAVASAAPSDCGGMENSIAGLGACVIHIAHSYAPHSLVGLHASGWATKIDVLGNTDPMLNVTAEAQKLGAFFQSAGAMTGDLIVADMSDRDAGYCMTQGRNTWWDATNATLPNFHQAFAWGKAVAESLSLPMIWWQIPVGNMMQNNTPNHWQDNRVDYLLGHPGEVAAAHGAGLFFGAGRGDQTTPESDGNNLIMKTQAYEASPTAICTP